MSAPSVALKNTGEYLQTPRYNEGIVKFSFMYRFASSGTGSYIVVEKESDNSWTAIDTLRYVDTSKNYPEYTFSIEEHVTSVKVVYAHKEKGNVAVDDASITYGAYVKDIFSQEKVGNITTHVIEGLSPQTEYGYQVRSVKMLFQIGLRYREPLRPISRLLHLFDHVIRSYMCRDGKL